MYKLIATQYKYKYRFILVYLFWLSYSNCMCSITCMYTSCRLFYTRRILRMKEKTEKKLTISKKIWGLTVIRRFMKCQYMYCWDDLCICVSMCVYIIFFLCTLFKILHVHICNNIITYVQFFIPVAHSTGDHKWTTKSWNGKS